MDGRGRIQTRQHQGRRPQVAAVLAAALCIAASGCATYSSRMSAAGAMYYGSEYDRALRTLDGLVSGSSGKDVKLLLLERGKVRLAAGMYDSAIVDLRAAERRFDEISGTVSVHEALATTLVSQTREEYQPDPHEKILINAYLLLAHWLSGDAEGARVERNRLMGRLSEWADPGEGDGRRALDVPFARYLAAIMYENEGLPDDARIEYDAIRRLRPGAVPERPDTRRTEIAVLAELGRSPVKVSREIRGYFAKRGDGLAGFFMLPGADSEVVFPLSSGTGLNPSRLGTVFTFAFPEYVRQPRRAARCAVYIDGAVAGPAVTLDDLEGTAREAFRREMGTLLLKSALRTYLQVAAQHKLSGDKGQIVGLMAKLVSAVERADTRSWQTLPAEIAVLRIECEPGQREVRLRYFDERGVAIGFSPAVTATVGRGRKQIVWIPGPQ